MTTPKPALPEPVALIDPRALARGDASLHCITRPEYRSIADADAGVEYVPVYTRAAIDAAVAEARAGLERECDDTDKLLRGLGLDPERCRTEGGALNVGKTLALLAEARAVPVAHVEETPAGPKLYVNGVCVRWELGCVHDAAFHELARRINSTNPSPTEPPACARWAEAQALADEIKRLATKYRYAYTDGDASHAMRNLQDAIDRLAAMAQPAVPQGWQPIETAPKDGTPILAFICWLDGPCVHTGHFSAGEFWPDFRDAASKTPTHWMPLPAAPTPSQGNGEHG